MDRVKSGVSGLDELFQGGVPRGSNILLYGKPGTGKTLLALEFLYRGAAQFGESGVFVSFDQNAEEIIEQCEEFGWKIRNEIKKGRLSVISMDLDKVDREFIVSIMNEVKRLKAKRLVIDNLALLSMSPLFQTENKKFALLYREKIHVADSPGQLVYNIISILKRLGVTTFYITIPEDGSADTIDGISEYVCDGVIRLGLRSLGKSSIRTMEITKMRRSKVNGGIHAFDISEKGIWVEQ